MRFLLIDRIDSWEPGKAATAVKNVSLSEDFFDDHFPEKPIMPGVLILEGIAQLSGLLLEETVLNSTGRRIKALMSIVEKAKFRGPVYPGDQLTYSTSISAINELGGSVTANAVCGDKLCAECRLVFSFFDFDRERLERRQQETVSFWMRDLKQ